MEWLLKILDLFRTEKEGRIKIILLDDLKEWLDLRTQEIMANSNLDEDLISHVNQLKDKRWLLECRLDEWEKKISSRKNTIRFKVDKQEISVLFKATRKLLDLLTFTEKINLDNVIGLTSVLGSKLEKLIRFVEESDFAADFDFLLADGKENDPARNDVILNPLLKELIELDGILKAFEQKIAQCGYHNIRTLAEKQSFIINQASQLEQIEDELRTKQEKLALAEDNMKDKEAQIHQIKEDPGYISQEMVLREREEILKKIEDNKDEIFTFFSKLKSLLLEYKELGFKRNLIDLYLEDPVNSFLNDESLSIRPALEHMKTILNSGRFSLSFKNVNSILNVLEKGEGRLEEMQKKHFRLVKELENFEKPFQNSDFLLKIEDANYRLTHFSEQVERLKEKIGLLEEKAVEIKNARDREIESFQDLVRAGFGKNISINF